MSRCLSDHGLVRPQAILPSPGSPVTTRPGWPARGRPARDSARRPQPGDASAAGLRAPAAAASRRSPTGAGDAGGAAAAGPARGAGGDVRGPPSHGDPRRAGGPPAAGPAGGTPPRRAGGFPRSPACPPMPPRTGSRCALLAARSRSAVPARPAGVRAGQEEDEHHQVHQGLRRARAGAAGRVVPARPDARPDRTADRRHRRSPRPVPAVRCEMDVGYRGLHRDHPGQVSVPPGKPARNAPPGATEAREQAGHDQSSERICMRSPIPGAGGPCSAGSADARTCQRPSRRSDHWCPTAPLPGDRPPPADHADVPGKDVHSLIAHHVVILPDNENTVTVGMLMAVPLNRRQSQARSQ
jgi:hypothetical protein